MIYVGSDYICPEFKHKEIHYERLIKTQRRRISSLNIVSIRLFTVYVPAERIYFQIFNDDVDFFLDSYDNIDNAVQLEYNELHLFTVKDGGYTSSYNCSSFLFKNLYGRE